VSKWGSPTNKVTPKSDEKKEAGNTPSSTPERKESHGGLGTGPEAEPRNWKEKMQLEGGKKAVGGGASAAHRWN